MSKKKRYGDLEVLGDSACPSCREQGRDSSGNHLVHYRNIETDEELAKCGRCGHYETINDKNREELVSLRKVSRILSPQEIVRVLEETEELPIQALVSRGISLSVARRFGVRVGVSSTDGETAISHFYPKTVDGEITGYKVRNLDPKYFYSIGAGKNSDLFGINQARKGDVYTGKLFIFEDELSAMSGFQVLSENTKSQYEPAVVALPDGAGSAAAVLQRNHTFISVYTEIVVCMDNDKAGESAAKIIRALYPHTKVAKIPKGKTSEGKDIKDANDMLMEGRGLELNNSLRYCASTETPSAALSVSECIADALKKPTFGVPYPWEGLTKLTYGLNLGELVSVGGGTSVGKSLLAHELASWFTLEQGLNCGVFMLEEGVGSALRNIAGKSANIPFHKPDVEYSDEDLIDECNKYDSKLWLYSNEGQNEWSEIKQCIKFWVINNNCKVIFLDNVTTIVSHLSPSEINTEVSLIASELASMCQELNFTCFVFSHLNPPSSGDPHELGGSVKEIQFTGSRALMRFSQLILGFERNKQADGMGKHNSIIRLLKDRKYGASGVVYTKYVSETGRLVERKESEVLHDSPFEVFDGDYGDLPSGEDKIY